MIAPWLLIASLASIAIQAPVASRITGTIRDVQACPIPGAIVTLVGETARSETVSDPAGAFSFAEVPAGRYSVTVTLAGFRPRVEQIVLRGERPVTPLNVTLAVAPLATILWVLPSEPVAEADVIAHIRIVRTALAAPCRQAVTTFHEVEVIVSLKGSPERRVMLGQEGAGECADDDGRRFEGLELPYRADEEYIVFLRPDAGWYGRLAGPHLTFPVVGGRVRTRGFGGLAADVTVEAFRDRLTKPLEAPR